MENAAWGYALRGVLLTLLTVITLGAMLPYQTYKLTKYRTDRTWFGNAQLQLDGRWTALYGAMKHIFIGLGMIVAGIVLLVMAAGAGSGVSGFFGGALLVVGYFWGIVGGIHYRVDSFKRLTEMTQLNGTLGFRASIGTGEVIWRLFAGSFIVGGVYALIAGLFLAVMVAVVGDAIMEANVVATVLPVIGVLIGLTVAGAFSMAMIVQPIVRMVINGITVTNAQELDRIRQRAEDEQVDADGLADALDFGGAI